MSDWDGTDRRHSGITLNDILLEVREVKNDVRHLVDKVDNHVLEDKEAFGTIRKDLIWVQRIVFGAIGAWFVIQLFIQLGAFRLHNSIPDTNNRSGNVVYSRASSLGTGEHSTREGSMVRRSASND